MSTLPSPHRFVLIRHAEASCNVLADDDLIETYDPEAPLTAQGREQAAALAQSLPNALLGSPIFASPMRRALETAHIIAEHRGGDVRVDDRLGEMNLRGKFDPPISVKAWDGLLAARIHHPDREPAPGMESLAEQDRRVTSFLRDRHRHRGQNQITFVLAHAFTIELALLALLGLDLGTLTKFRFRLSNSAVHIVENAELGGPSRLLLVNAKNHLHRWL
jgi:5''-phosphoribostamycin phosphatase